MQHKKIYVDGLSEDEQISLSIKHFGVNVPYWRDKDSKGEYLTNENLDLPKMKKGFKASVGMTCPCCLKPVWCIISIDTEKANVHVELKPNKEKAQKKEGGL